MNLADANRDLGNLDTTWTLPSKHLEMTRSRHGDQGVDVAMARLDTVEQPGGTITRVEDEVQDSGEWNHLWALGAKIWKMCWTTMRGFWRRWLCHPSLTKSRECVRLPPAQLEDVALWNE